MAQKKTFLLIAMIFNIIYSESLIVHRELSRHYRNPFQPVLS